MGLMTDLHDKLRDAVALILADDDDLIKAYYADIPTNLIDRIIAAIEPIIEDNAIKVHSLRAELAAKDRDEYKAHAEAAEAEVEAEVERLCANLAGLTPYNGSVVVPEDLFNALFDKEADDE